MSWVAIACVAGLAASSLGDDVVYSAAHVREVHGKFFPVDTPHLYRVGTNGKNLRRITFGDRADTQPSLAPDHNHVLFWRKDKSDLISNSILCSVATDGTGFKELLRFLDDGRLDLVSLKRAYLGAEPYRVKPVRTADDVANLQVIAPNGNVRIKSLTPAIAPGGRWLTYGKDASTNLVDLRTGKEIELRGIPSEAGGTAVPVSITWIDDSSLINGFYDIASLFRITTVGTLQEKPRHFHRVEQGRSQDLEVFASTQWRQNPDGVRAFRYGVGGKNILLQVVGRTEDGGSPATYGFVASTGEVRFIQKGLFFEDEARDRRTFLVSSWNWGKGWLGDGTAPLRTLSLWDVVGRKAIPITAEGLSCEGACFVPETATKRSK
ncbi:MAG: hypothetical protein P4L46_23285 [Fimbriimonas sp.]|nr:hypothetical protein [Fimbriimonas sp.]